MWQKFLKKNQDDFLFPPYFKEAKVKSEGGQIFTIKVDPPSKHWCKVNADGDVIKTCAIHEIFEGIKNYPGLLGVFMEEGRNSWIVGTKAGVLAVRGIGETCPLPLTRLRVRLLGKALLFEDYDYRDSNPWRVSEALEILKNDELPEKAPTFLCEEQRFVFELLMEKEKVNRIPPTEQKIKNILNREGARLINMKETRDGYSLSFNYKGTQRSINIKEDLMLTNSGMCLSGRDSDFSLDSFLTILHHRGRRNWRDHGLYL